MTNEIDQSIAWTVRWIAPDSNRTIDTYFRTQEAAVAFKEQVDNTPGLGVIGGVYGVALHSEASVIPHWEARVSGPSDIELKCTYRAKSPDEELVDATYGAVEGCRGRVGGYSYEAVVLKAGQIAQGTAPQQPAGSFV